MGSTLDRFVERVGVPDVVAPMLAIAATNASAASDFLATARTSEIIDMQNLHKAIFSLKAGTAASATGTLTVQAATSTAASDFATLTGYIGTATNASATATITEGQLQEIEVHASALRASNYRYLRAIATVDLGAADAYMLADLDIYVTEASYGRVRDTDMLSYQSTNATDVQDPMYVR